MVSPCARACLIIPSYGMQKGGEGENRSNGISAATPLFLENSWTRAGQKTKTTRGESRCFRRARGAKLHSGMAITRLPEHMSRPISRVGEKCTVAREVAYAIPSAFAARLTSRGFTHKIIP